MKPALVAILMFLLLSQTFSKWLVVMDYQINKDFIAKNLCDNKTKPKLRCNGKCQMMKKLAEEEKENTTTTNKTKQVKVNVQEVVLSDEHFMPSLLLPVKNFLTHHAKYLDTAGASALSSIFHPPAAA